MSIRIRNNRPDPELSQGPLNIPQAGQSSSRSPAERVGVGGNRAQSLDAAGDLANRSKSRPFVILHSSSAFTLVEIMVVVVILGILAATIIPQFIGTTHDAKISAAKADVTELESAIERFYVHMDRYPSTEEGLKVLVDAPTSEDAKNWRGPYVKQLRDDPWGNAIQYRYPGTHHPNSFDLWSGGADGKTDIGNW